MTRAGLICLGVVALLLAACAAPPDPCPFDDGIGGTGGPCGAASTRRSDPVTPQD